MMATTMLSTRIFVVESDPAVRDLFDSILTDEGYAVQLVDPVPLEPLQVVAARPQLLLLELTPTDCSQTLELIEQLRSAAATARLPVLVSCTDPKLLARLDPELSRLGCAPLLKPFDLDELLQVVRAQLHL